jgi:hypothetical protein
MMFDPTPREPHSLTYKPERLTVGQAFFTQDHIGHDDATSTSHTATS